MSELGPIVCGTDLSPASQVNVELAARVAAALGRPLHLVFVTGAMVEDGEPTSEAERVYRERLAARVEGARAALDKAAALAAGLGPHVEPHLLSGRPWEALLGHAEKASASIVCVGSHGHSGPVRTTRAALGEWLLGSTADRVVRHSHIPVLVGPREAGEHAHTIRGGTWLVAVDFSPQAKAAIQLAERLAGPCDAKMVVVHAMLSPLAGLDPVEGVEPFPPLAEGEINRVRGEVAGFLKTAIDHEVDVEVELTVGEPSEQIAQQADERDAKLVVMGTHGRTGLAHLLLGSVAERTLRRCPCPVLIVPK